MNSSDSAGGSERIAVAVAAAMNDADARRLRVLVANERRVHLDALEQTLAELGHEVVVACEVEVPLVGSATVPQRPDVALVGLGENAALALQLIDRITHESACPVIVLLRSQNPAFIRQAAARGIFAYIVNATPADLQSAIDITLQRFTEYCNLQGAFARRAEIEQAKGILMARHVISASRAFEMLRARSHTTGRKVADVASAVIDSHQLFGVLEERTEAN